MDLGPAVADQVNGPDLEARCAVQVNGVLDHLGGVQEDTSATGGQYGPDEGGVGVLGSLVTPLERKGQPVCFVRQRVAQAELVYQVAQAARSIDELEGRERELQPAGVYLASHSRLDCLPEIAPGKEPAAGAVRRSNHRRGHDLAVKMAPLANGGDVGVSRQQQGQQG